MRTLYFDCFAGASGNMILGALIAAGVDVNELSAELRKLNLPDFELTVESVDRSGISAVHVSVEIPDEKKHRHLPEIESIIVSSTLSDSVKARSIAIFRRLADAEAKVHGIDVEKVHFHEVGAFDALIDIVGSCIGFEMLHIERFECSKIHVGSGFVEMAHGKFPVPPPAVTEILKNIPIYSTEVEGELITPTGAALIAELSDSYNGIPEISLELSAYGAGTRNPVKFPNVLRILIGESNAGAAGTEQLTLLETNIDDLSPQILGYVMERAFELEALDCWFTPIQMKKNRPATMVSILCSNENEQRMLELLYRETTTIGVRVQKVSRNFLDREVKTISTEFGEVGVKIASRKGEVMNSQPEFEHLKTVAKANDVPLRSVLEAVRRESGDAG
jgi:uncharacterized protein (TIGR00299 family) protein